MLVECEACGAKRDFSILEVSATCPACGAPDEELTPVSKSRSGSDPPYTVLLAEDDSGMRETYRVWLSDNPHWKVQEATDGAETLVKLDSTVDILVLDRRMPKISGPEVVDRLDETTFDGSVLVLSAYEPDEHLNENDVEGYLTKPVRKETFIEMLEQVVD